MLINIIHLSESQVMELGADAVQAEINRRQLYLEQMAIQRAKYKVWPGIIDRPPYKGVNKAHKQVIRDAKEQQLPMVCVAEDDIVFTHPTSFNFFLRNMPPDFDIYAGLLYYGIMDENNRITNGASGIMSIYMVSEKFYDTFLSVDENDHIDRALGNLAFKYKYIVCFPHVVVQAGGYSYNHRRKLNYDEYLRDRTLFSG